MLFQEPSDIALSTFAQIQALTALLNDYITVTTHQEISAVSTALCDTCFHNEKTKNFEAIRNVPNYERPASPIKDAIAVPNIVEDEDGYCEIEDIRIAVDVPQPTPPATEQLNVNESGTEVDESIRLSATDVGVQNTNVSANDSTSNDVDTKELSPDGVECDEGNIALLTNVEGSVDNLPADLTSAGSHMEVNDAYDSASQVRIKFSFYLLK